MALTDLLSSVSFPRVLRGASAAEPSSAGEAPDAAVDDAQDGILDISANDIVVERVGLVSSDLAPSIVDPEPHAIETDVDQAPTFAAPPLVRDLEGVGYVSRPVRDDDAVPAPLINFLEELEQKETRSKESELVLETPSIAERIVRVLEKRADRFATWTPSTPLPSQIVLLVAGLSLSCLSLLAAMVLSTLAPDPVNVQAPAAYQRAPDVGSEGSLDLSGGPGLGSAASDAAALSEAAAPASFPAEPLPIPTDLLTGLEAAGDEPLDVELSRLLEAIQFGFGSESVQLEPTLRSYVYRMASRFEWNRDSFRIAVTAPSSDLARAREAVLGQLFKGAVSSGRLQFASGTGPHALSLVTD